MPANIGVRRDSTSLLMIVVLVAAVLVGFAGPAPATEHDPAVGSVDAGGLWTVPGAEPFFFGIGDDIPFLGDFDGDGTRTPGLYRPSTGLAYVRNTLDTGIADISWFMGIPGDIPLVGDWNGNGTDSFGVYRDGTVYLRNDLTTGVADISYSFGIPDDLPFAGDFDGDGIDTVGLHRPSTGEVFLGNSQVTGEADHEFFFGDPGDVFVSGDWDGDGIDTVGVVRPSADIFFFRNSNDQGFADGQIDFSGDLMPVVPHVVSFDSVELRTDLTGGAEVPGPGDEDGTGEASVSISGLDLSWSITVRDIAAPTAAHIHAGTPDASGPVIHSLSGDGSEFADDGDGGLFASGELTISAAEAAALAASPGAFYVNVHNGDFAPGALRGNLSRSVQVELVTELTGEAEVPGPGDDVGSGEATVSVSGLELSWSITVREVAAPTAAHIHSGTPDASGPVVHSLSGDGSEFEDDGDGGLFASGELTISTEEAAALASTPGAFYVNVHNADFAPGALRGNLTRSVEVELMTDLSGGAEVPGPGDEDGTGEATISISGLDLSWSIAVSDIADPTAAHIHSGTPDASGPVVHSLSGDGSDFEVDGEGGFFGSGELTIPAAQAAALAANPGAFYVNVHNADFAPGAIRGNLG